MDHFCPWRPPVQEKRRPPWAEHGAPSASLGRLKARGAPIHPGRAARAVWGLGVASGARVAPLQSCGFFFRAWRARRWVINTVGFYNRKFFLLFLLYACLTILYSLAALAAQLPALFAFATALGDEGRWLPGILNVVRPPRPTSPDLLHDLARSRRPLAPGPPLLDVSWPLSASLDLA